MITGRVAIKSEVGWGTHVCQDCGGWKYRRDAKRCRACNFKSAEFREIQSAAKTRYFEDPDARRRMRESVMSSPKARQFRERRRREAKARQRLGR